MNTQLRRFLAHLHRAGTYSYWWLYPARTSIWWPVGKPKPIPTGRINVYFGVHPCRKIPTTNSRGEPTAPHYARSQTAYIEAINCLYAEFDGKDHGGKDAALAHIRSIDTVPSVIVDSGGGYHVYWLLDEPYTLDDDARAEARRLQHAWVEHVGGDSGAKDLARVLRVPGTTNYKQAYAPDYPQVRFAHFDESTTYHVEDLREHVASLLERTTDTRDYQPPADMHDAARKAALALDALSPRRVSDYHDWLRVGMALSELGSEGRRLWAQWSRQSEKYRERDMNKWTTFTPGDGITLGTLYHMADEDAPGWWEALYDDDTAGSITRAIEQQRNGARRGARRQRRVEREIASVMGGGA